MLIWKDLKSNYKQGLCEENRDEEDLVNLVNPPKQRNHYIKPASKLKPALKSKSQERQTKLVENRVRSSSQ
jgi:hypothetical protein